MLVVKNVKIKFDVKSKSGKWNSVPISSQKLLIFISSVRTRGSKIWFEFSKLFQLQPILSQQKFCVREEEISAQNLSSQLTIEIFMKMKSFATEISQY